MSDEPGGARPDGDTAELVPAPGRVTVTIEAGRDCSVSGSNIIVHFNPETVALGTAVAIYSKAFLEALGKRTGEGVADLSKRLGDLVLDRGKSKKAKPNPYLKDEPDEAVIGVSSKTAMIVVAGDTPDEARLALLDLDVTAEEVRGKTLRWDATAGAWVPDDEG